MESIIKCGKKVLMIVMCIYCFFSFLNNLDSTPDIRMVATFHTVIELSEREQKEIYQSLNNIEFEILTDSQRKEVYNPSNFEISYVENGILHEWFLNGALIKHTIHHDKGQTVFETFDYDAKMYSYLVGFVDD